ncbi:phospholipase [Massilia sp.]|uniref:phospholipase n=1 Tax=Massilia sp. TaxID=1882437 RepID=UPI00352D46F1
MTSKQISQLISADGAPIATAVSAPGCFVHDDVPIAKHPDITWGKVFSEPSNGNSVDFYVTGEEYFAAVADAIAGAEKSIYIAGWQVNFDVELTAGKTLYECLEKAIDSNPALRVYIMPWLSPKAGVNTGDFETMLAVYQLNAGLPSPVRAFALPAIAQSDMAGALGIGFSHHQKLVVIDEVRAFVGGIDLAYGRRDNGRFPLAHEGRVGNEVYNTCIPPIHELTKVEQVNYLTRNELICACFDGFVAKAGAWWESASGKPVATVLDWKRAGSDFAKDKRQEVSDWWNSKDLMPEFIRSLQDKPVEAVDDLTRWTYRRINQSLNGKLDRLRQTGSAHVSTASAALVAWLNHASLEQLPAEVRQETIKIIEMFGIAVFKQLSVSADNRPKRYKNLRKVRKMLPTDGKVLSPSQPRMPWHDVHASIMGPAVSDLSRNFIRRWNAIAHRYEVSYRTRAGTEVSAFFDAFGLRPTGAVRLPRISPSITKKDQSKHGKCWVQVLRSAPATLQRDEQMADRGGSAEMHGPVREQNNCLKAMLTAIYGSQNFIYIEGQFFQSAYGADSATLETSENNGPMSILTDVNSLPDYQQYTKRLGIFGVPWNEVPGKIKWVEYDDIARDIKGKGNVFVNDLKTVLGNIASIKASLLMGKPQERIFNPIGEALAARIEKAIFDGQPFHVYMVLPVHPEGTLDTLNIMTQLHLTMQSLVFGSHSLVNRINRAILTLDIKKKKNISVAQAKKIASEYPIDDLRQEVGEKWKSYLTLLNLRNWDVLDGRPVTEQIYVHSKLLIADDRVAILGSANINDRSQLGNRDSELAVVIRDDEQKSVKLDGVKPAMVSSCVHGLRVRLWKKLFGLMGSAHPAHSLINVVEKPAAKESWEAIQRVAYANATAYKDAFPFLPAVGNKPSSIWPTWNKSKRALDYHMPFNERFWRDDEVRDTTYSWHAKARVKEKSPKEVQGFIVALPLSWTEGENNLSAMNLTMLAKTDPAIAPQQTVASTMQATETEVNG